MKYRYIGPFEIPAHKIFLGEHRRCEDAHRGQSEERFFICVDGDWVDAIESEWEPVE